MLNRQVELEYGAIVHSPRRGWGVIKDVDVVSETTNKKGETKISRTYLLNIGNSPDHPAAIQDHNLFALGTEWSGAEPRPVSAETLALIVAVAMGQIMRITFQKKDGEQRVMLGYPVDLDQDRGLILIQDEEKSGLRSVYLESISKLEVNGLVFIPE